MFGWATVLDKVDGVEQFTNTSNGLRHNGKLIGIAMYHQLYLFCYCTTHDIPTIYVNPIEVCNKKRRDTATVAE